MGGVVDEQDSQMTEGEVRGRAWVGEEKEEEEEGPWSSLAGHLLIGPCMLSFPHPTGMYDPICVGRIFWSVLFTAVSTALKTAPGT